ncbi:MAG: putative baseplate assembly protein [Terriglobia bacterium]
MNQPCGCCAGIQIVTPEPEANRPGLSAIVYRVGTQATFFETMLARLSNLYLDLPAADGSGSLDRISPLAALTTRELDDPSIALLDAWATVADVLTFYQERIANEGYLGTATERLSILQLARLVGYRLRPGVSASVYLAFTVAGGFTGAIPSGTRAQSIPGAGQMPQFFETSASLAARDVWNDLGVRLTRPQIITLGNDGPGPQPLPFDPDFDARTRDTVYFQGISTNLKVGDRLLFVAGEGLGQQALRPIVSVEAQASQNRTEVVLQEAPPQLLQSGNAVPAAVGTLQAAFNPFIEGAASDFPGSDTANRVVAILTTLLQNAASAASATAVGAMVQAVAPQVQQLHDNAAKRGFTRLEPWTADILASLNALALQLPSLDGGDFPVGGGVIVTQAMATLAPSALAGLTAIVDQLALPPSVQPANSIRLARTVAQTFSPQSDTAPRLLAAFKPAAALTLYKAWGNIAPVSPSLPIEVNAVRAKATLFASTYGGPATVPQAGGTVTFSNAPTIANAWTGLVPITAGTTTPSGPPTAVALDATYEQIQIGTWVAIDRPSTDSSGNPIRTTTYHQVQAAQTQSMDTTTGFTAKVTVLTLNPLWLSDSSKLTNDLTGATGTAVLRGTVVYAQAETLGLAEEPLDRDVEGNTIELDGLYDGLESGRWIIVSGERTDITDSAGSTTATGVTGDELVMIAAVTQGAGKQSCLPYTTSTIPFTSIYYVTDPNAAGDQLVVGVPAALPSVFLNAVPLPSATNQQICDPVQLAPGFYANAYVPTAAERGGDFSAFGAPLIDPANNQPFAGGQIPAARSDPTVSSGAVFAWRTGSVASGSDTPHTTLVLANNLAYKYDSTKVTVYGNVAKATHGQTVGEVLGDGNGGQSLQKFTLGQSPLTYLPAPTPAGAKSTLVVRVNEVEWHEADSLAGLGPRDRDYITQADDAQKTAVIFGTGDHGARLPTGSSNVKATYRYGIGASGNVDAQQISQLATHPLGAQGVINPLRASGGADRDSRDQGRHNAPLAVEALDRLVSVEDYADFARTYAGIGKASSVRLTDGRRLVVHVTIAGAEDIPIDPNSDLYQNFVQALYQNGDPYQAIQVALRKLKLLVMSAGVKVLPDYLWESVEPNIRAALLGTFGFDQRDLGQSAFLGEVISTMQAVEGVSYVNVTTFDSVAEDVTAAQLASLTDPKLGLQLQDVVEADLAKVVPTETDPTKRIVPAELAIVTPDIPDTVILTQITT